LGSHLVIKYYCLSYKGHSKVRKGPIEETKGKKGDKKRTKESQRKTTEKKLRLSFEVEINVKVYLP
jgi:hypothetical protein